MRQVVLDTETTGLEPSAGHRIIEIGCVELVNRRFTGNTYHQYIKPDREIDAAAIEIHGITNESLADKPMFVDERGTYCAGHWLRFPVNSVHHPRTAEGCTLYAKKSGLAYLTAAVA